MKHHKLTKILALLLAVVIAAGLMAGCGDSGKVDPEDQTVIRLLLNFDAKEEIESILPIFEKAHPEIRVEIMDSDSGVGETPTALSKLSAAGDLPDVAFGVENFAYILSQGLAYPLDNLYAN
ncbi:MAG: extracellular solute-binding protein, partial [Clostridia bacterium]|nr:extracellular solute-binding protein [Clostridia bacterium]